MSTPQASIISVANVHLVIASDWQSAAETTRDAVAAWLADELPADPVGTIEVLAGDGGLTSPDARMLKDTLDDASRLICAEIVAGHEWAAPLTRRIASSAQLYRDAVFAEAGPNPDGPLPPVPAATGPRRASLATHFARRWELLVAGPGVPWPVHETACRLIADAWARGENPDVVAAYETASALES